MPKSVLKSIQTCFEHVLGKIFRKKFCPVFHGRSSLRKFSKKNQKSFKFPKMPKIVPKSIQTCFSVIFLEKLLCPVFHGGSSFRKFSKFFFFKIPKMPKIVPESIQACFERVLGQISRKIFLPSVPWRVEFSKIFKKKFSKFQKWPKVFPRVSKRVLNMFWGKFFEKFYAQCSMEGRVFENFQKKYFQNSKIAQKCSQKYPNLL